MAPRAPLGVTIMPHSGPPISILQWTGLCPHCACSCRERPPQSNPIVLIVLVGIDSWSLRLLPSPPRTASCAVFRLLAPTSTFSLITCGFHTCRSTCPSAAAAHLPSWLETPRPRRLRCAGVSEPAKPPVSATASTIDPERLACCVIFLADSPLRSSTSRKKTLRPDHDPDIDARASLSVMYPAFGQL